MKQHILHNINVVPHSGQLLDFLDLWKFWPIFYYLISSFRFRFYYFHVFTTSHISPISHPILFKFAFSIVFMHSGSPHCFPTWIQFVLLNCYPSCYRAQLLFRSPSFYTLFLSYSLSYHSISIYSLSATGKKLGLIHNTSSVFNFSFLQLTVIYKLRDGIPFLININPVTWLPT